MAVVLAVEPHPDEGGHRQAQRGRINEADIVADDPRLLELADAAQTRTGRQADPRRQIMIGDPTIGLKLRQDPAIYRVED
jgi:hypothetical protein